MRTDMQWGEKNRAVRVKRSFVALREGKKTKVGGLTSCQKRRR